MNKNQCNKLKFMLTGIQSRLEENLSFFKEMEFSYKSGKKKLRRQSDLGGRGISPVL